MIKLRAHCLMAGLIGCALASITPGAAQTVAPVSEGEALQPIPTITVGRVVADGANGTMLRQWPGTYWETRFDGPALLFRLGPGRTAMRVWVDGQPGIRLDDPAPGLWRVAGLTAGPHHLRVQVVGETQGAPTGFGGFLAPAGTSSLPVKQRARQIELIGDSHTVGYGNLSTTRDCTDAEVAATTDSFAGLAGHVAARFGADVVVNAISGRGVVRNYDGFTAPTLPQAWPFALFEKENPAVDDGWSPQLIVVALGTNDFSTPLRDGEHWQDRAALQADYRATYANFLRMLRIRHPSAYLLVWATDLAGGEVIAQAQATVAGLQAGGERRIGFVPVADLTFAACHHHPDLADDAAIAAAIVTHVEERADIWPSPID